MVARFDIAHPHEVVARLCLWEGQLIRLIKHDRFTRTRNLFSYFLKQLRLEAIFHLIFSDARTPIQLSSFDEALFIHLSQWALTCSFVLDVVNHAKFFHLLPKLSHLVGLPTANRSCDDWLLEICLLLCCHRRVWRFLSLFALRFV